MAAEIGRLRDDAIVEQAVFGREIELWLQSPIGDYLMKRAEHEIDAALQQLKRVHPWRRRRITELQNQVRVAEWFQVWLGDAIQAGRQATEILEEEQNG